MLKDPDCEEIEAAAHGERSDKAEVDSNWDRIAARRKEIDSKKRAAGGESTGQEVDEDLPKHARRDSQRPADEWTDADAVKAASGAVKEPKKAKVLVLIQQMR